MLSSTNKIELVVRRQDGSYQLHLIVEMGEWALPNWQWLLQEKCNAAASYALDGQLHKDQPDSIGQRVSIAIRSVDAPPVAVGPFVQRIREALQPEGLGVSLKTLASVSAAA